MIKRIRVWHFKKNLIKGNVKVKILYGYDCVEAPDGTIAFGVYDKEEKQIYVAGDIPIEFILTALAHEYCHYLQDTEGRPFDEDEARRYAEEKTGIV